MKDKYIKKRKESVSLKKLDDPDSKDFWEFVEKSAEDWREQQPAWSRELDRPSKSEHLAASPPVGGKKIEKTSC